MLYTVVTTIQPPTDCMRRWSPVLSGVKSRLVVMGDKKGPDGFDLAPAEFHSLDGQSRLGFELAEHLPTGHYARKNLGYLRAMQQGAQCIYETDDDNAPLDSWRPRTLTTSAQPVAGATWFNPYRVFSDENVWPRGFPLRSVRDARTFSHERSTPAQAVYAPIQQGLADLSPDVDAVWRLALDHELYFNQGPSLWLPPGTWCPFNSQSTWWWPEAYPLMYLPSYCSFRMTDIWRSFIAQRCLWEMGHGLVFHAPEVIQQRNEHDLMRDFADEVPGYLRNEELVQTLGALSLESGAAAVGANLLRCYRALVDKQFFDLAEMRLVEAWLKGIQDVVPGGGGNG
jgi:hypothetical protein